jgi:hypothetical protein
VESKYRDEYEEEKGVRVQKVDRERVCLMVSLISCYFDYSTPLLKPVSYCSDTDLQPSYLQKSWNPQKVSSYMEINLLPSTRLQRIRKLQLGKRKCGYL